jgi:undecaprenyl-diphosphatase
VPVATSTPPRSPDPVGRPAKVPRRVSALEAIVLGIVQGLTEFLPVSSTAHLRIVPAFVGWPDPGAAFTAVTQLGTMTAVLLYFRQDLWRIARTWLASLRRPALRSELDARMGSYIALGTIPIAVFGFIFRDQIESGARSLYLIGAMLIAFGLVLLAAERAGRRERDLRTLTARDGAAIGFAQALALVPGVSRSGATISAGLFVGLDRESAARYSFLLSVPAVVLSGLFELRKVGESGGAGAVPTAIATLLAFAVGYASIALLLRWLAGHSTIVFVAYRIGLGALVIALTAAGAIS